MNNTTLNKRLLLVGSGGLALLLLAALLWLYPTATAARTGAPPPALPAFEGEPVTADYAAEGLAERVAAPRSINESGWVIILEDDFEGGIDTATWLNVDRNGAQDGEYKWGTRDVENTIAGGQQSAWGVGGGADGDKLDPTKDGYPKNVDSWLIHGPVDMERVTDANLEFNYWFEAEAGDTFSVLVSTDGTTWEGKQTDNGGTGTWLGRSYSMAEYVGAPKVYIAFRFSSDDAGKNNKVGPFVDDVVLRVDVGSRSYLPHVQVQPSPTPSPTPIPPTPTPSPTATPPSGLFIDNFTDDIDGWAMRRERVGASFDLNHRADTDGGRQGFLEMELRSKDAFVMVSPLVPAKAAPYNIEIMAKLKSPKDRQMYGIVFGGDWDGQACPTNCFNRYYELRVQYRDLNGKQFQEVKLKRIDTHDANGEPEGPTLIDWTKGGNVGSDDWIEIDVNVTADGFIRITWNGKYIAEARDATLISQPYFGLQLITRDNENARVKFDYIKID
jgi:hypothetical protein